jgi:hypothetical protein
MMDIPVYIINRNRLTSLKRLIGWLALSGTRRIIILDNGSIYERLLGYYDDVTRRYQGVNIEIIYRGNEGPYAFWDLKMHEKQTTPYIVTDSDVVPADICPMDLISKLVLMLDKHPDYDKIGPGIRIDNLPGKWPGTEAQIKWEKQFWLQRVDNECFKAAIDTTFAIYRNRFVNSTEPSLRLDHPYLIEHIPWYKWPLDEEEQYYRDHCEGKWSTMYTKETV